MPLGAHATIAINMLGIDSPTPEGFAIEEVTSNDGWTIVREVGKLGYAVWEYRLKEEQHGDLVYRQVDADAAALLDRIADLESICDRLRGDAPTSIELRSRDSADREQRSPLRRGAIRGRSMAPPCSDNAHRSSASRTQQVAQGHLAGRCSGPPRNQAAPCGGWSAAATQRPVVMWPGANHD